MRKLTKFVLSIVLMATTSLIINGGASAQAASKTTTETDKAISESYTILNLTTNSTPAITPRADAYEWRYKSVNGVIYKRLYNTKKGCWVGEWQKV